MTTKALPLSALALLLLGSTILAEPPKIGGTAPDFTLPTAVDGKPVALKELLGGRDEGLRLHDQAGLT